MDFHRRHHEVTIYTSPGSRMCELAKSYFLERGIETHTFDVERSKDAFEKMVEISGQRQTPVLIIDGRLVVGYHPEVYEMALLGKAET